jgi:hypothetical protein
MAQGLLERVVTEANTPAADPSAFNAKLKAAEEALYGIEALSRTKLYDAQQLQNRRLKLKHGAIYRPISLDALRTFRTKEGWPAIAIFGLDSPRFEISLKASPYRPPSWEDQPDYYRRKHPDEIRFTPDLPKALANCFTDVVQKLETHVRRDFDGYSRMAAPIVLAAQYDGLIPLEVKAKISEAKKFFSQIFILAEPIRWSLKMPAILPDDPIVVGWDGRALYFIAEYETTAVEDALLCEGPANKGK